MWVLLLWNLATTSSECDWLEGVFGPYDTLEDAESAGGEFGAVWYRIEVEELSPPWKER